MSEKPDAELVRVIEDALEADHIEGLEGSERIALAVQEWQREREKVLLSSLGFCTCPEVMVMRPGKAILMKDVKSMLHICGKTLNNKVLAQLEGIHD